jgi:restriction endonuclease Mrr
MARRGVGA